MIKSLSSVLIGYRLINLNVTYSNNGVTGICGFYPGLLSRDGDHILFFCPLEAHATSVKLQIQSNPEQRNTLNLCEVEIYKKRTSNHFVNHGYSIIFS